MSSKTLVLVDGSSYLYRAFFALPPLTNAAGQPTGAVYGVINMINRLLSDYQPDYIGVVFDARGSTFRHEMYHDYKANRAKMPDDLACQIEPLLDIIRARGLPLLQEPGVEADDVIGTLATQGAAQGLRVIISTGDKDLAQLVDERVTLIDTMKNKSYDIAGVEEKFGVSPDNIIGYLALVGDTSDNIPGVNKVGAKTAAKWLNTYGSLDDIIAHADAITGKVGDNLRAGLDTLVLSRDLATIRCDVPLDQTPTQLIDAGPDVARLDTLYQDMGFSAWRNSLPGQTTEPATSPAPARDYQTISDEATLAAWIERLDAAPLFAFDTETTSVDYMAAELVGLSFAITPGEAAYVPLAHQYDDAPAQLDREHVLNALQPLLEGANKKIIGHHIKYDSHVLARYGIHMRAIAFDTMLESYVLDATASRHNMDALARKYLGIDTIRYEDVAGKGAKQCRFDEVAIDAATQYAAEDADVTLQLHQTLWPKLQASPALADLLQELEMPTSAVLTTMEAHGVHIDRAMLAAQSEQITHTTQALKEQAYSVAGEAFNLGSPKQLQHILFEKLGLPVIRKTPKGQPSTAEDVLHQLAESGHELPQIILDYRGLSKLQSTYTDRLPECISPRTGRVHTSYQQAVASTGRLSSANPNLQNIPVRSAEGRRIREAFVAPPGCTIVAADYSQIELRIMAHLSGDNALQDAFNHGEDVHATTAAEVFGVAPEAVTRDQRRSAKAINFGLIYGMSAFGLARQLDVDRRDAQAYIDAYFDRFKDVKTFMDQTREKAHNDGYVETVFGRRLYLPDINSRNGQRRQYAERTAINAPMQGTAADIIKRAMIAMQHTLDHDGINARMIMQVHDELVFEVADDALEALKRAAKAQMEAVAQLAVALKVDIGQGHNWQQAH